jgi:hypothetical protein
VWCIQNGLIPEDSLLDAAIGPRLSRVFLGNPKKLLCDEMLRVPELPGALIRDSAEGAMYGCTQVRRKHGLPHHQYPERRVRAALQELFDCGGPPQTGCSRGRKEQ